MVEVEFFVDRHGRPRALVGGERVLLSGYLEQDIQSDQNTVELICRVCARIATGELETWEGTGNAHTVVVQACGVRIENEFSEDSVELSLASFETAVRRWGEFLKKSGKRMTGLA